jgi:2-amino-4-hydroxy-6-hydroxymethyldihydropteridine diphosphokinase
MKKRLGDFSKLSPIYETGPVGNKNQPWFLNCCAEFNTTEKPEEILKSCQEVERELGRTKGEKWGPRVIDVDILFYGGFILDEPNLKIPHPEIANRRFVLEPLAEIAPDFIHPILKENIKEMLRECEDRAIVRKHNANPST